MNIKEKTKRNIEILREDLYRTMNMYGVNSKEALLKSKRLNRIIVANLVATEY